MRAGVTNGSIPLLDLRRFDVETPQGWIDVPPRPGTFVINIGELLELASTPTSSRAPRDLTLPPA